MSEHTPGAPPPHTQTVSTHNTCAKASVNTQYCVKASVHTKYCVKASVKTPTNISQQTACETRWQKGAPQPQSQPSCACGVHKDSGPRPHALPTHTHTHQSLCQHHVQQAMAAAQSRPRPAAHSRAACLIEWGHRYPAVKVPLATTALFVKPHPSYTPLAAHMDSVGRICLCLHT